MDHLEVFDCVMLAAGSSTRMPEWKMALPMDGGTLIEHSVRTAMQVCQRLILVAGYRGQELQGMFQGRPGVQVVLNPDYARGMFSSIQRGCREVATPRFFLALGDMPLVQAGTYRVLTGYRGLDAVSPKYRGKRGHPLLLTEAARRRILATDTALTLHEALAELSTASVPVEDARVLQDVDEPEDYRRLSQAGSTGGR